MKTKRQLTIKSKATKFITSASTVLCTLSLSMQMCAAAPPEGVNSDSYNALVGIIFWIASIAVAAAGAIPSIIKIVQGQADEDPRGRNAGIAGLVITGACVGALFAIKALLF